MNLADPEISSIWREIDISSHKTDTENLFPPPMSIFFSKYPQPFETGGKKSEKPNSHKT